MNLNHTLNGEIVPTLQDKNEIRNIAGEELRENITSSFQDSKPRQYSNGIKSLSLIVFAYAFIAYLNEAVFHWLQLSDGSYPLWFNRWTEYIIIVIFGTWRFFAEKNSYTKKRILVITTVVGLLWWIIPYYKQIPEVSIGNLSGYIIFPSPHTPGTISFFIVLALVFLFGRRLICGWGCPCVGIRETVGFPFRVNTVRTDKSGRFRHVKWIFFTTYFIAFILIVSSSNYSNNFFHIFYGILVVPYFLSMLLSPILGNRSYCRFICPFGAMFGILNNVGIYDIKSNKDKCNNCKRCEKVCDMAIPISTQIKTHGCITTLEECMGCGRCIISCPQKALAFKDVRNLFNAKLHQDRDYLLRIKQKEMPTSDTIKRPNELGYKEPDYPVDSGNSCL